MPGPRVKSRAVNCAGSQLDIRREADAVQKTVWPELFRDS